MAKLNMCIHCEKRPATKLLGSIELCDICYNKRITQLKKIIKYFKDEIGLNEKEEWVFEPFEITRFE